MKNSDNLFELFHADTVDEAELTSILLSHFGGAMQPSVDEIVYPRDETDYSLKLVYGKRRLIRIEPGPRLSEQDVASIKSRIEEELLKSTGTRVGTEILFSSLPVDGRFRYTDRFQILPVPPNAPRPPFQMGAHPLQLQFRFAATSNWSIRHLRRAVRGRELELVLTGLLTGAVHSLGRITRNHWVLLPHEPEEEWKAAYCQEMYIWPGMSLESEGFSPLKSIAKMQEADPQAYYTKRGIGAGDKLEIPSNFEDLLDRFHALARDDRDRFLRACFWFQHASRVHSYSRSAAFTALISAIEALLPKEQSAGMCNACGRKLGKTIRQRFSEFVDKLAPGASLESDRKRFYDIRSKLSHGGSLLHSDRTAWGPGLTPKQAEEWADSSAAWQLVRIVLVNWLASQ